MVAGFTLLVKDYSEELFATLFNVMPNAAAWVAQRGQGRIEFNRKVVVIDGKKELRADLFFHGKLNFSEGEAISPLLFVHGDYGHPFTLLNLANDLSGDGRRPIFSLYLYHCADNDRLAENSKLIQKAAEEIKQVIVGRHGRFEGITGVGHSKGATLLADQLFCQKSATIQRLFSIAGRLNSSKEGTPLESLAKRINMAIRAAPSIQFCQVTPRRDEMIPQVGLQVEGKTVEVNACHLSVLYSEETMTQLRRFVQ